MAATADRVFSVLKLFTVEQPDWTVEAIAARLGLSASTAYQYVGSLVKAGFLIPGLAGAYFIGPAVIELDRVSRLADPFIHTGGAVLRALVERCGEPAIGLRCRLYRLQVICIDRHAPHAEAVEPGHDRGGRMPLFGGAASQVIVANLPTRTLRTLFDRAQDELIAAGLGADRAAFRQQMRAIQRKAGHAALEAPGSGVLGIAAPIMGQEAMVLGSIGLYVGAEPALADPVRLARLTALVAQAGEDASAALRASWERRAR